jgi:Rps23 Pro-64 3,4-dihydroxylase Tpa1-like proline 4-hydroxylase
LTIAHGELTSPAVNNTAQHMTSGAAALGQDGKPLFKLNPKLDAERLAARFSQTGRVHIPDFLEIEQAAELSRHLRERQDWRLVLNDGEKLFELDRASQAALDEAKRAQLDLAVYQRARRDFQFRYETVRVPDSQEERLADPTLLVDFARFLSSQECLSFLRSVTGLGGISFADAQATAYGPQHFLTTHDDAVAGKNRYAAYVFNLTPEWRADWGGLLMFHGADGHIEEAFTPRFNALNIFRVPQLHSVSFVAPFVPFRRYAVTGWLRGSGG